MKRFISIIMILTMLLGMQITSVYADSVKTAFIDFESGVPEIFTRRGGRADLVAGISPDGSNNACQLQWGSTYYINDGNAWVNFDTIYYNADIYTQNGATFVCFST